MGLTDDKIISEQEWHEAIKKGVSAALGAKLDGEFTSVSYPAGFDYQIKKQYYSKDSLAVLDTLVVESEGIYGLGQSYSSLYHELIEKLVYDFSSDAKEIMKEEEQAQNAMVGKIIKEYQNTYIYDDNPYPSIRDIMNRIKEETGSSYMDINEKEYPDLAALCRQLKEYTRLAVQTGKFENEWSTADDRLNAIIQNITEPTEENGGIKTSSSQYNIGWEQLPTSLLDKLKSGNSVNISFSSSDFNGSNSTLHFESKVQARVPISWLFNIKAENEHSMDFQEYAGNDSVLEVSITFNGVTTFSAVPMGLSNNNKTGWYAADIIRDTSSNSGKDVTGYKLNGDVNRDKYFGKNGALKRLKTFVIAQEPVVHLHFSKFNCSDMEKFFHQNTKVKFSILGGLISSGTHENDYTCTEYSYNEERQTIDVTLNPPEIGDMEVAYILGGVVEEYQ